MSYDWQPRDREWETLAALEGGLISISRAVEILNTGEEPPLVEHDLDPDMLDAIESCDGALTPEPSSGVTPRGLLCPLQPRRRTMIREHLQRAMDETLAKKEEAGRSEVGRLLAIQATKIEDAIAWNDYVYSGARGPQGGGGKFPTP